MLRITVEGSTVVWRLRVEGMLGGPWVTETEKVWLTAPAGRTIEIDVRNVRRVDEAGRRLLRTMHESGARLLARGITMNTLIAEISGSSGY